MIRSTFKRFLNAIANFVKKLGWPKSIALALLTILLIMNYFPVKLAVYDKHIPASKETTVIVELAQVTGASWWVAGDSTGLNNKNPEYIDLEGNIPYQKLTSDLFFGGLDNKYVLYGKYVRTVNRDYEKYRVFKVIDWDFLYPIKRSSIGSSIPIIGQLLSPDRYLNIFDFLFK